MRALEFIRGHVIYNPDYTYKFQLKTTKATEKKNLNFLLMTFSQIFVAFSE